MPGAVDTCSFTSRGESPTQSELAQLLKLSMYSKLSVRLFWVLFSGDFCFD